MCTSDHTFAVTGMTNHLKYIDVREYARVVDMAKEFAERAEKAEAAVQRVRELPILGKAPQGNTALRGYNDGWNSCRMATLRALDGDSDE